MLRCGASVGHANTLIHYQERDDAGALRSAGFNALVFNDSTTPTQALVSTPIAGQSLILRREAVDEAGGYSEETLLADQELQLRLAGRYVFAYADSLTNEWRVRSGENRSAKTDATAELRKVFDELHPLPDRPLVEADRRKLLTVYAQRPKGYIFEPSVLVGPEAGPA
jgi:hypothetical protein